MKDRIFSAFDQVHAEEALIEKTLEGMYSYREKKERRAFFSQHRMAIALSFAMMLCIGLTGWQAYFVEAFALSVDVNPSIEMTVNRLDRVISAKGLNKEGQAVVSSVNVVHMNYADAVDTLLEEEKVAGYLEEEGTVLVAVACTKEDKAAQVKETIDTAQAKTPQTVAVIQPEAAVVEEAVKHDMSFGKYQAYLDIQEVAPAVTTEEVKEMSVQEIATIMSGDTTTQTGVAIGSTVTAGSTSNDTTSSASSNTGASTNAGTTTNTNTSTNTNNGTNANTSATPNSGTNANTSATPNSGTNANTSATPNSGTNANTGATQNGSTGNSTDKKPAGNTTQDNSTADKKPVVEEKPVVTPDNQPTDEEIITPVAPTEPVDDETVIDDTDENVDTDETLVP